MNQAYDTDFARAYNLLWGDFAQNVAPRIYDFYTRQPDAERTLLDVCCGTGQLARYFLERDFTVTGVDLSEPMILHARQNTAAYRERAAFIVADAADFRIDGQVGLAVSTFDALNHLPDAAALRSCFACVHAAVKPGGMFIFDLNTRAGLWRWNSINVNDTAETTLIFRGIYDGGDRGYTRITGYIRDDDGRYSRFEETAYNVVYDLADVHALLAETGWHSSYCARAADLGAPLDDPEKEGRAFFVATR
ncbi:MAG: class I SAM-dependent methyltransferase [Anaerolinea sp.]|nr:class I SAM-dependent methyltransferase [Anaerolinea sp.]